MKRFAAALVVLTFTMLPVAAQAGKNHEIKGSAAGNTTPVDLPKDIGMNKPVVPGRTKAETPASRKPLVEKVIKPAKKGNDKKKPARQGR